MEKIKTKNFAKSVLKSAAVTLSVQALGKNLNKDNFGQTLLVIAAGGWDTNKDGYKNGADFMQLALANGLYVEDVEKKKKYA